MMSSKSEESVPDEKPVDPQGGKNNEDDNNQPREKEDVEDFRRMVLHEDNIVENSKYEAMLRTTEHVAAQNCNIEDQLKHLSGVVSDLKEFIMQQQ
jgi:deoxyribodipyrimidine photolyase-like uncharacterized protein